MGRNLRQLSQNKFQSQNLEAFFFSTVFVQFSKLRMGWETPLKVDVKMIAAKGFEHRSPVWSMWVFCGLQCLWCHIAWWADWGQGHPSTRCSIVHPGSWVLMIRDTNIPYSISCCENGPVSSPQIYSHHWSLITTFHPILHWSRLEGVKNLVSPSYDRGMKHSWQEPEGKHQNTLFQVKNTLLFQY